MVWNTAVQKVVDGAGADRFPAEHLGRAGRLRPHQDARQAALPIERYAGFAVAGQRQAYKQAQNLKSHQAVDLIERPFVRIMKTIDIATYLLPQLSANSTETRGLEDPGRRGPAR